MSNNKAKDLERSDILQSTVPTLVVSVSIPSCQPIVLPEQFSVPMKEACAYVTKILKELDIVPTTVSHRTKELRQAAFNPYESARAKISYFRKKSRKPQKNILCLFN